MYIRYNTHIMLMDDAIVYPTATPKRFRYWNVPQMLTWSPSDETKTKTNTNTSKLDLFKRNPLHKST